jgi:hypothetical protein
MWEAIARELALYFSGLFYLTPEARYVDRGAQESLRPQRWTKQEDECDPAFVDACHP